MSEEYGKWISVKEKLPGKGDVVLVFFGADLEPYMDVWMYSGTHQYFAPRASKHACRDVTHWMPLPNPPEGEK